MFRNVRIQSGTCTCALRGKPRACLFVDVRRLNTLRLHSCSFLEIPYRILNMNPKKELLWSLQVHTVT